MCMTEENKLNRRRILKTVGVAAAAGTTLSQSGTAQEQSGRIEFEKVDMWLKWGEIVGKTTSSTAYRDFQNYFEEELNGTAKPGFATVLKATKPKDGEVVGYIVNVPVHGVTDSDIAGISATIRNGDIETVSGSRRTAREDGTVDIDMFRQGKQGVKVQNFSQNPNKIVDLEAHSDESDDTVHTQGLECTVCKALYNAARSVGCSVTAAMLCAAAGFGTAGGALTVCTPMVPAFCAVYNEYQNVNGMSAEDICGDGIPGAPDEGLGYC